MTYLHYVDPLQVSFVRALRGVADPKTAQLPFEGHEIFTQLMESTPGLFCDIDRKVLGSSSDKVRGWFDRRVLGEHTEVIEGVRFLATKIDLAGRTKAELARMEKLLGASSAEKVSA